jgi:ABC-2 type transport system ATP-binding protein
VAIPLVGVDYRANLQRSGETMLIVLGIVALGLVWWFVGRQSAQRRRAAGHRSAKPGATFGGAARRPAQLVLGTPVADAVIEMTGVSKSYGRGERRCLALDGLDLTVPAGEVFGLLGQNGAGKTTAMRCMLGLVRPTAGTCRILGADSARDLHRVIDRVGALIETPGLTPSLSGRRNLLLLARLDRMGRGEVSRALETAGLTEQADDAVATYSLGMRQRLGVAAALLRDPEVLVLDEPANGLDPAGIAEMRHLLVGLAGKGRTILVSSHLLAEAEKICDRIAVIEAGRCVAVGPIGDVLATAGAGALIVRVDDPGAAQDALAAAGVDSTISRGALRVGCAPADGARITEILAAKGLYISEMRPVKPTLEAAFLGLTSPTSSARDD